MKSTLSQLSRLFQLASLVACIALAAPLAQAQTAGPAAVSSRVTQAVDDHQLVTLRGNVNPQARSKFDQGAVDDAQPATRALVLLQRSSQQEAALRQLLDDQQNRTSANYHQWLTPAQFGAQFGPADSDVLAVTQWLTTHGFQNIKVGAGKTEIEFSGNVGQMREAFHTDIHKFLIRGQLRNANISDPQIPSALSPVIAGVVGLTNFRPRAHIRHLGTFRKTKATGEVKPLFTYNGCGATGTQPCYAIGPGDFAKIYSVPATVNGNPAGQLQTIVVVNDSNINVQDVIDYRSIFGLPANFTSANVIVNGPDPGINGDEEEADLDTQIAGAVAPNATVILVVTEQPDSGVGAAGVDLSVLYTINNNLAPVVSKSFGLCEPFEGVAGNQLENALWEQAAAQGISGMVSAGDTGSAACDPDGSNLDVSVFGQAVSGDASTPFNVAVGGTDFNSSLTNYGATYWTSNAAGTQTSALSYIPEITWNDSCARSGSTTACTTTIINEDSAGLTSDGPDITGGAGGPSNCTNSTTDEAGDITCINGYPKPSWQTGTGVPNDSARDLPDVSLFASNGRNYSFYIICEQDANTGTGSSTSSCDLNSPYNDFQGVGGTSASSPAFAAIMALVNQKTGQRQGNANYVLYPLAAKAGSTCTSAANPASTCVFYDIPAGSNNSVACQGDTFGCSNQTDASTYGILIEVQADGVTPVTPITPSYSTTAGYDLATGLGSVNVANLLTNWASASFKPTTTTFSLNSGAAVNITDGGAVSVSGAVTSTSPGTPTGFVELFNPAIAPIQIIDTFQLASNGTYSGTTVMLPGTGGTPYTVSARYGGDGTFAASTSSAESVNSVIAQQSETTVNLVTFDANGNPSFSSATSLPYGSPYILLISVTKTYPAGAAIPLCVPPPFSTTAVLVQAFGASLPCPNGTVTLLDNGNSLPDFLVPNTSTPTNSAKLNNTGFAEDQPIQLPGGPHSLTASFAPSDHSFTSSTSAARALTITTAATATAISASSTSILPGASITFTAVVSSSSNSSQGPTGTVQFYVMQANTNVIAMLGSPATCTPAAATATAGASCTATLPPTSISLLAPPASRWEIPRVYLGPLWTTALVLLAFFLLMLPRVPTAKRRVYAYAVFACATVGIAGCGGGGGGGGGTGHIDDITATYSGDANYATSGSAVLQISVQ